MKSFILLLLFLIIGFSGLSQNGPTTEKCKNTTNDRVRKDCIIKEVKAYADTHFNVAKVANHAKIGSNKIYAQFKVSETAEITDIKVKATTAEIEAEAVRVIQSFPNMIPSEKSMYIPETFNLLIVFEVDDEILKLSAQQITDNN